MHPHTCRYMTWAVLPVASLMAATSLTSVADAGVVGQASRLSTAAEWPSGGQNLSDTHSNPDETEITRSNVESLRLKWTYTTTGDVSATPAVVGNVAYFSDFGGELNAVNAQTGALIWRRSISSYDGIAGSVSRTSPAVSKGVLYIGDLNGAHLMAINAATGNLLWITQLDTHPYAILTASPIVAKGVVYEGVSSGEEGAALNPGYPCCTFRGSMTAVDATTGAVIWKTYMVPDNGGVPGGYSGAAIWSSTPAFDKASDMLYVTTGNNYTVPAGSTTCQENGGTPQECLDPGDHIDSIVALNASNGAIVWADGEGGFDTWTLGCQVNGKPNCPTDAGPDADFGSGAQLFTITGTDGKPEQVVGAGQKSGVYWLADAATGAILWGTQVGPGGAEGGMQWGAATDGKRIYVAESDSDGISYTPVGHATSVTYGSWAALDPQSGRILWQTPDPSEGIDIGQVTEADGLVYAGSLTGYMYAISARTGKVLWNYHGSGSSNAGPAIVGCDVYWGNGYAEVTSGVGSTTFYAFAVPGCRT